MPPKDKKAKPEGWNFDLIELIILVILFAAIFMAVIPMILSYFASGDLSFYGFKLSGIINFFRSNVQFFKALGYVFAGAAAIGTFSFTKMADAVWRVEKAKLFPSDMHLAPAAAEPVKNDQMSRWDRIIKLSESENESDWRLAIIEADIMLDELLEKLELPGDTMGEKLKAVEKSDFTTIEYAWEAHKARNTIAHEGTNFLVSQREVRRIISLYEAVFKEFGMI